MDYIENSSNNPHLFSGLVWRLSGGFMFCFGFVWGVLGGLGFFVGFFLDSLSL